MRINDQNLIGISSSPLVRTPETETGNRQGRAGGAGAAGGDQVQLSNLAGNLRSLSPETAERVAYLEKLSAEVRTGRYSVDAQAVSRSIVDDALENRA
jgi:anti-sigma28 factor (negative regulator of flagellin synthesis)